ncbi:hypothetical protein ACLESD_01385 [Pyxidicoccus sp. 3LFB2]
MLSPPWNELVSSILHAGEYGSWFPGRWQYLRDFTAWQLRARYGQRVPAQGPKRLTVILLSYRRIGNMEPLVRNLLLADFVDRILISNNNPEYRIADWVRVRDERLHWVDQPVRRPAGVRFELARSEPGEYFVSIDDDTFISPEQLRQLFATMIADPSVPHGFQGECYEGEQGPQRFSGWRVGLRGRRRVDGLNRLYCFTREHLEELFRLASILGLQVGNLANGEDLLLSFSGKTRPLIEDIGHVGECLSAYRKGTATWRTHENFFRERRDLWMRLREIKLLESAGALN